MRVIISMLNYRFGTPALIARRSSTPMLNKLLSDGSQSEKIDELVEEVNNLGLALMDMAQLLKSLQRAVMILKDDAKPKGRIIQ